MKWRHAKTQSERTSEVKKAFFLSTQLSFFVYNKKQKKKTDWPLAISSPGRCPVCQMARPPLAKRWRYSSPNREEGFELLPETSLNASQNTRKRTQVTELFGNASISGINKDWRRPYRGFHSALASSTRNQANVRKMIAFRNDVVRKNSATNLWGFFCCC